MQEVSRIIQGGQPRDIKDRKSRALLQTSVNRIHTGEDLALKFAAEIAAFPNVWEWIRARIRVGNFEDINVGDFVEFTAGGNTIVSEVAGINTYTRYGWPSEHEVGNHIDFISRDLWPEPVQWNLVDYNNGLASMPSPYLVSNVYALLNSLQTNVPNGTGANPATVGVDYRTTGILALLPAALRNVIVPKVAIIERRHTAGILLLEDNSWGWYDLGQLWLPSEVEICGTNMWSTTITQHNGRSSSGFVQYPIFAGSMKRIKGAGHNGGRAGWWLCTVAGGWSTRVAIVTGVGAPDTTFATRTGIYVPICFRIA